MNNTRYTYKKVPISDEDARKYQDEKIRCLLAKIQSLREEVDAILKEPLPTERVVQIELNPEDKGYEDAPHVMNPIMYQGKTTWLNQTSTPNSK
jgi:hypothetical protein